LDTHTKAIRDKASRHFGDEHFQKSIAIARRFDADPAHTFAAWIEPAMASQWLFRTKVRAASYSFDVKTGGSFSIKRSGASMGSAVAGEYLMIDPPRVLAFTVVKAPRPDRINTVVVELRPDEGGCMLMLVQHGHQSMSEQSIISRWELMLDELDRVLHQGSRHPSRSDRVDNIVNLAPRKAPSIMCDRIAR
jgi:uncharacterized protein YndB with AHSA1/START domain